MLVIDRSLCDFNSHRSNDKKRLGHWFMQIILVEVDQSIDLGLPVVHHKRQQAAKLYYLLYGLLYRISVLDAEPIT